MQLMVEGEFIVYATKNVKVEVIEHSIISCFVVGDKFELTIPSELAYGDSGSPPKIPGGSVLQFVMEIISISGDIADFVPAARCDVKTRDKCTEKEIKYLDKIESWTEHKMDSEISRLKTLSGEARSMKPDLAVWIKKRLYILQQLNKAEAKAT